MQALNGILSALGLLSVAMLLGAACTPAATPTSTVAPPTATRPAGPPGTPTATPYAGVARGAAVPEDLKDTLKYIEEKFVPPPVIEWKPRYGGEFRPGVGDYANLDPTVAGAGWIHYDVYSGLLEQELGFHNPELEHTMKIRPLIAERWEQKDPVTYIFYIRKGVKWQNVPPLNGREFTAEDVKYALEVHMKGGVQAVKVADIAQIEAPDKYTLKVTLKKPFGAFLDKLASPPQPYLFPRELHEQGKLKDTVVGTGPYILKELRRGEGFLLEKNPDYWEKDKDGRQLPFLDRVRGFVVPDWAAEEAAFRTKKIDTIQPTTIRQIKEILKTNPDTYIYRAASMGWGNQSLMFRLDKAPFNDIRVRRAISLAMDRDLMLKNLYDGDGDWYPPIPWIFGGITEWPRDYAKLGPWYRYDPAQAKKLLAEAGFPNGFKTKIQWAGTSTKYPYEEATLMMAGFLKNIGIDAEVQRLEVAAYNDIRRKGEWDAMLTGTTPVGGPLFDEWVYGPYHGKSPRALNVDGVDDAVLNDLLDKHRGSNSEAEQKELVKKIWDRTTDQVWRTTTVLQIHYQLTHPYLVNFACAPYNWIAGYGMYNVKNAWMREDAPKR